MTVTSSLPVIVAHRGASGYLPEHTLEAKAMAHALRADFLEQDIVLTRDDVPIVLHDIHLDTVTDVARVFPDRAGGDGRFYAIDFTWDEIRRLNVSERFDLQRNEAVFPNRFPVRQGHFQIPRLEDELEFLQGLNKSTRRNTGIYPEIKQPHFHRQAGKDITRIVLDVLTRYGYVGQEDACYLQCFDPAELRRIREEFGCQLKLIQLLEEETCRQSLISPEQTLGDLSAIARYANGIGPSLNGVFQNGSATRLVPAARDCGLLVHPWTYRSDALMGGFDAFYDLHAASLMVGVDGVFTDFPDQTRALFLQARNRS